VVGRVEIVDVSEVPMLWLVAVRDPSEDSSSSSISSSGNSSLGGIDGSGFSSRLLLSRGEYSSGIVPMVSGVCGDRGGEFKAYMSSSALSALKDPTLRLRFGVGSGPDRRVVLPMTVAMVSLLE